jgi:hypothetical protein
MENSFNEKLGRWAEKSARLCREIALSDDPAKQVDKWFYAFQSPPREAPGLLILGFNPAEDFPYSSGSQDLQADIERMKNENPCWGNRDSWLIWKNLKKYFASDGLKALLEESVYMNEVYFNSANEASLSSLAGGVQAIRVCRELTQEVIFDIIRPEKILCLGVSSRFDSIGKATNYQVLGTYGASKKLLIKKICRETPVYAIPHPSGAQGVSDDDRETAGKLLAEELLNPA